MQTKTRRLERWVSRRGCHGLEAAAANPAWAARGVAGVEGAVGEDLKLKGKMMEKNPKPQKMRSLSQR
jgi:hypothetical protein